MVRENNLKTILLISRSQSYNWLNSRFTWMNGNSKSTMNLYVVTLRSSGCKLHMLYFLNFMINIWMLHYFWDNWFQMTLLFLICFNKIVWLNYSGLLVTFFLRGGRCTLYPLPCINGALCTLGQLFMWWSMVLWCCVVGIGVAEGDGWFDDPWCAYLNRFSPAPSSHWGFCTLIWCAGTLDPHMQRWVALTKVIVILLLTYPHVFE